MEPSNLNDPLPEEDELDALLRAHASPPPLADDGFSQRVLAALPANERFTLRFKRQVVCATGLAAGTVAAAAGLIRSENLNYALGSLDNSLTQALNQLVNAPMGLALGLALLSLAFAFRSQWRLRI